MSGTRQVLNKSHNFRTHSVSSYRNLAQNSLSEKGPPELQSSKGFLASGTAVPRGWKYIYHQNSDFTHLLASFASVFKALSTDSLLRPGQARLVEQEHPPPKIHRLISEKNPNGLVWTKCSFLKLHLQEIRALLLAILDHMALFQGNECHDWQSLPEPQGWSRVVPEKKECCRHSV